MNDVSKSNLPDDWELVPLDNVVERIRGRDDPQNHPDLPYVGLKHIEEESMQLSGKAKAKDYKSTSVHFQKDDILYGRLRPYLNKVYVADFEGLGSGEIIVLTPKDVISTQYLAYLMNSQKFVRYADLRSTGDRPRVNYNKIAKFEVPLPPKDEQIRIVSKIDELVSKLSSGVKELKDTQNRLESYKTTFLKEAMSGGLTRDWRRSKHDDLEPASEILGEMGGGEADTVSFEQYKTYELPERWKWAKVSQVGEIILGTTPDTSVESYYGEDYPFYKPTSLDAGYYTNKAEDGLSEEGMKNARHLPAKSTLVTSIGSTIGKTGFIRKEGASNQQINAIIPHHRMVPEFVYFACKAPNFQLNIHEKKSATTTPILNKTKFSNLPIPVPPTKEQMKIKEKLERVLSIVESVSEAIDSGIAKSRRLRRSVLKKAFEGNLVPRNSGPPTDTNYRENDNPGEQMIEQRTQKTLQEATKDAK